jgi:opacity protein-like surface antigen
VGSHAGLALMSSTRLRLAAVSGAAVLAVVMAAPPASAAPAKKAAKASKASAPAADASFGYSYEHSGEASLHGWQLTYSHPFGRSLRAVGDLSGHYGSFGGADLSDLGLFAGARWTFGGTRLVPFAQGLLGLVKRSASAAGVSASDTDFGFAFGGGADYGLNARWAVRAQAELLVLSGDGVTDTDPRLSLSAVYRFGRR